MTGFKMYLQVFFTDFLRKCHCTKNEVLKISSVNVTKSAENCGFGHIYWRNSSWKTSFFVQCLLYGITQKSTGFTVCGLYSLMFALRYFQMIFVEVISKTKCDWMLQSYNLT